MVNIKERRWKNEHLALLAVLETEWGAKTESFEKDRQFNIRGYDSVEDLYPGTRFHRLDHTWDLTVQDCPVAGGSSFESSDDVEYWQLSTSVSHDTKLHFHMGPGRPLNRMRSFFGLRTGISTGVPEIDDSHEIIVSSKESLRFVQSPSFIEYIKPLLPVHGLRVKDRGLYYNLPINSKTDFALSIIEDMMTRLLTFAKILPRY